ncbi:hypothetical protein [Pseudomonas sp. E102]|uniref:hypothetical protein n=1 Tax=Pseudomonas sp. E102 TaxID=181579 RepID=UPI004045C3A7
MKMQERFCTYSVDQLPAGFKYPSRYLDFAKSIGLPKDFSWWFDDASTEGGQLSWKLRGSYGEWVGLEGRNLIPFAQLNDDAAFFDGDDLSGDPKVVVIDLGNKERVYELPSFEAWLHDVLQG